MIKFVFDKKEVLLPTCWEDVSVSVFTNPDFLSGDSLKLLASASGIAIEKLAHTTKPLNKYFKQLSAFIVNDPQGWRGDSKTPETFDLMGIKCTVPMDINYEMFGQKVLYGNAIAKHENPIAAMSEAIAIYLSPQIDPEKWHERIDEIRQEVEKLPITKVYPVADFFLLTLKGLPQNGQTP